MTNAFKIYIVDDGADYRFLLQQVFKRFLPTYSVSFFSSGNIFLHSLSRPDGLPNLVLIDRQMPKLTGHEVLRFMKNHQLYKHIPAVIISATASPEDINLCYQVGGNSFLIKAVDFDSMKTQMIALCQYWSEISAKPGMTD